MKAQPIFPSVSQIRQLPADLTMKVPPEWEDLNGHVNVQYYLSLYEKGGWETMAKLGFDERNIVENKTSVFDLENHIRYIAELNVGDTVSVHSRTVSHNEKLFHGMFFIVNDTHEKLASTIEYLSVHIDMEQRRSAAFSAKSSDRLSDICAQHSALEWPVPVSGIMNL